MRIVGKHVYSLGARWGFGLALCFATFIATAGAFALGFIPIYFIVEYWWLKKEDLDIPYSSITGLATNEARQLVAVSFDGHQWCSPVVLRSPEWKNVADGLRFYLPAFKAPPALP